VCNWRVFHACKEHPGMSFGELGRWAYADIEAGWQVDCGMGFRG
jgi:hypothetical protein